MNISGGVSGKKFFGSFGVYWLMNKPCFLHLALALTAEVAADRVCDMNSGVFLRPMLLALVTTCEQVLPNSSASKEVDVVG